MKFKSLNNNSNKVDFLEAAIRGLAPDKGLYFPEKITKLDKNFFDSIHSLEDHEIAKKVICPFIGNVIDIRSLDKIIEETISFPFPILNIEENIYCLELFHGPTLAFKDIGAKFMAKTIEYIIKKKYIEKITVLVATSGDTGGAVANGFYGINGIEVIILYPKNRVTKLQEKQLTTLNGNVSAIEVSGSFDDCQNMVKRAFIDEDIISKKKLTSANSINVARWLPQMFYYFLAYKNLKIKSNSLIFSVPSGNFGNICAGLLAKKIGLPISNFVASTNINDVIPKFIATGSLIPKKSKTTISNAMDVGDPSNFIRILKLFDSNLSKLKKEFSSFSFNDQQTKIIIKKIFEKSGYILEPHGAIGYLGLKKVIEKSNKSIGVFLETAHPIKFSDSVEKIINTEIEIPKRIQKVLKGEKKSVEISNYDQLKNFILKN
tara:strand:+ start:255 stop:1553 length:1299 start_codon:yes stop_codon:yes gene_type:complete